MRVCGRWCRSFKSAALVLLCFRSSHSSAPRTDANSESEHEPVKAKGGAGRRPFDQPTGCRFRLRRESPRRFCAYGDPE
jgi:hypothetical protein